jgi:ankyrin repeat protein
MNHCAKLIVTVCLTMLITAAALHAGEIHEAAEVGDLHKVKSLIKVNSRLLESKDNIKQTPLMFACRNLQLEVVNYLINKGANVNARNKYGLSVLCYAMDEDPKCVSLVKRLIEHGADVKMWEGDYEAPIHSAVSNNNPEAMKLLVKHGANPNINSDYGTPLQNKLLNRVNPNERISKLLVENGARALEYSFGNTDLHLAAMVGFADVCAALVHSGADINAKNEYDRTPLYYAARHGHRKAVEVLIAAGADKSAIEETNYGKAPQLTESLKPGEAYLWYLGGMAPGTGYAVKTKNHLLIFDPFLFGDSPHTYLAQGNLNPRELAGQRITVLLTRKEPHPYIPTVEALVKHFPKAEFIISAQENMGAIGKDNRPAYRLAKANESFSFGNLKIHTIQTRPSTLSSKGNLGYLVEADGVKVFHAGIHWSNNRARQIERFRKQIDFLKPVGPIDFAILPAGWHHLGNIDYKQNLYFIDQLSPKAIYYIGDDQVKEEHRRAVDALNERDVPVFYPDGGIAIGQRFHYIRN